MGKNGKGFDAFVKMLIQPTAGMSKFDKKKNKDKL